MTEGTVRPVLRVVANGTQPKTGRLKATIILSPQQSKADDAFELSRWPQEAAAWVSRNLPEHATLYLGRATGRGDKVPKDGVKAKALAMPLAKVRAWKQVGDLWTALLGPHGDAWGRLAKALTESLQSGDTTEELVKDYPLEPDSTTHAAQVEGTEFDGDGALLVDTRQGNVPPPIASVLPIKHADMGVDLERRRAIRVWKKLVAGPRACEWQPEPPPRDEPQPLTRDEVNKLLKQHHWARYTSAANALKPDRGQIADCFKKAINVLSGNGMDCSQLDCRPGDARAVPPQDKLDPGRDLEGRASHVYGSWLQRNKANRLRRDPLTRELKPLPADEVEANQQAAPASAADQRMLGLFHAVQGDAVLSRLFCLSVDVEFTLPEELRDSTYLLLWIARTRAGASFSEGCQDIRTAAKLCETSFWPVSVFEAGLGFDDSGKPVCAEPLIEQTEGMWRLGMGGIPIPGSDQTSRYDLASLDIRRAAESRQHVVSRDGAGEREVTIDGGERHITSGFTLLDRGRSQQIVRELAMARRGARCAPEPLVLYAEDLTIGRRVDVAAVRPGEDMFRNIQWRALMHRWVRYRFSSASKELDHIISVLLPQAVVRGSGHMLEEGAFQVAARHIPRLATSEDGDGPPTGTAAWDVAADEAIYTWDGTPAAVLTDGGERASTGRLRLPYTRDYDLPSTSDRFGRLAPPPLRYGVPYVFSLRSVFVGGGSPSSAETAEYHARTTGGQMLPPARDGRAMPRRFLRHESILAPTLLLPAHLAVSRYGVMGYEQSDLAVIRTQVPVPGSPALKDDERRALDGSPYAGLDLRTLPDTTMRVFIAPEASFEDVVRHGRLDGKNAQDILLGGLRNVSYEPPAAALKEGEKRVSGFPRVLTPVFTAMDAEGAISKRRYAQPHEEVGGIPVFQPEGRNTVRAGQIGWLPDPAAEEFCVRARARGSDRYLDGHLTAALYDMPRIGYPHALPLVLEIRRARQGEPRLIGAINELTRGVTAAPLVWIDAKGREVPRGTGVPVRRLVLELQEGEDLDLEVACLPSLPTLTNTFSLPETMAIQRVHAADNPSEQAALFALCGAVELGSCRGQGTNGIGVSGLGGHSVPASSIVKQCASEILDTIHMRWPVEEVAAVSKLRVCHAINRPRTKPVWMEQGIRRPESIASFAVDPGPDNAGSTFLLLTGKIDLDLEHIDAVEIVATAAAASGGPMDDPARGRSLMSRRSGRWPKSMTSTGKSAYVLPRDVFGFDVAANGQVTLPKEQVTLLRADNLPVTHAIGAIVRPGMKPTACKVGDDALMGENPLFKGRRQRVTRIDLQCLHASAITRAPLAMLTARPDSTEDAAPETRIIKVTQPFSIVDTRARRLKLEIRGLSRFAETFETAPVYLNADKPLLRRRQPLEGKEQSILGDPVYVWSPATERPAMCDPLRPEPTFVIDRMANDDGHGGTVHTVLRRSVTRLYFRRGWFSSGEGERLGIVLWPPEYFACAKHMLEANMVSIDGRTRSIAEFDDKDLGIGGAFITRWGGDPIRKDKRPQDAVFIPPSAFLDAQYAAFPPLGAPPPSNTPQLDPEIRSLEWMPVPREGEDGRSAAPVTNAVSSANAPEANTFLPVCLLTYEPRFDLDREEWYVDVDLRSLRPSEPFVRFGLVRFQPHAITEKLRVSYPTTVMTPLLPGRQLLVRVASADAQGDRRVEITLYGPGSAGIKPLDIANTLSTHMNAEEVTKAEQAFAQLQRPWLRIWVFHESGDPSSVTLRTPLPADPDAQTDFGGREVQAEVVDDELRWRDVVVVSSTWFDRLGPGRVVAYVEEVDRRMPATYSGEPISVESQFDRSTFLNSGPRFSARVPFLEVGAATRTESSRNSKRLSAARGVSREKVEHVVT